MPQKLNFLERIFFFDIQKSPGPFLDIIGGFSFYAVYSALQLNLFERLEERPLTVAELASQIRCTERGVLTLIEVLESLGYVTKMGDGYANSKMTKKWMLNDSPTNFSLAFRYYGDSMADLWPTLHQAIRTGRPEIGFYDWLAEHPVAAEHYQLFMAVLAEMVIPEMKKKLVLKRDERKVLDLGGGHGKYDIALCQKYADLSITIFDSPYSQPVATANIQAAGFEKRIEFAAGDYYRDDIGDGYDVVLLFNVIHEHTSGENIELMKRIQAALRPGGSVIIMDMLREKRLSYMMDFTAKMYSLVFFLFLGGQNYPLSEINEWLQAAGLSFTKQVNLTMSGSNLVIGHRN
jgi:SAM-dependent methyltransferase